MYTLIMDRLLFIGWRCCAVDVIVVCMYGGKASVP